MNLTNTRFFYLKPNELLMYLIVKIFLYIYPFTVTTIYKEYEGIKMIQMYEKMYYSSFTQFNGG